MDILTVIIAVAGGIATIGGLSFGFAYVFYQGKGGKNKSLEDANAKLTDTLNELIGAQNKKIDDLTEADKRKDVRIAKLEGQVEELSKKNNDLTSIINTALDRFFQAHPEEALKLAKKVN